MPGIAENSKTATGQGSRSWAQIAGSGRTPVVRDNPPILGIEREHCLALILPPKSQVTIAEVAGALSKVCKPGPEWMVYTLRESIVLEYDASCERTAGEKQVLITQGLAIKSITAKVSPLENIAGSKDIIEGTIHNMCQEATVTRQMKEILQSLGRIVGFRMNTIIGTGFLDGTASFVLDVSQTGRAPKYTYKLEGSNFPVTVRVTIHGRRRFCYYCRESSHLRKDCPTAPPCHVCGLRSHVAAKCLTKFPEMTPEPQTNLTAENIPSVVHVPVNRPQVTAQREFLKLPQNGPVNCPEEGLVIVGRAPSPERPQSPLDQQQVLSSQSSVEAAASTKNQTSTEHIDCISRSSIEVEGDEVLEHPTANWNDLRTSNWSEDEDMGSDLSTTKNPQDTCQTSQELPFFPIKSKKRATKQQASAAAALTRSKSEQLVLRHKKTKST